MISTIKSALSVAMTKSLRRTHSCIASSAEKIDEHLLDLYRVDKHTCNPGRDLNQRACVLKEPCDAHDRLVALPPGDEIAQAVDDIPSAKSLHGRRLADHCGARVLALLEQTLRPLETIVERRERLVQLMGEARGHLAERAKTGYVKKICLQFLQLRLRFLLFGQITYESRKMPAVLEPHLANRKMN